jgi:DNA-binding transcriptional MerR regulator
MLPTFSTIVNIHQPAIRILVKSFSAGILKKHVNKPTIVKRGQDQDATNRNRKKAKTAAEADTTSPRSATCEFCGNSFTTRGLKRHQKRCQRTDEEAPAKTQRGYNFCILHETLFEIVLSFLNNQTLTKLQMITGDRYPNCEPQLARYCCRCEKDNPVITHGLCLDCNVHSDFRRSSVPLALVREKYFVTDKDFQRMSPFLQRQRYYTLYDVEKLEILKTWTHDSKLAWVRKIAQQDMRRQELAAEKQERRAYLESLAPGFAAYIEGIKCKRRGKAGLKQASERFLSVKAALAQRGLDLETDAKQCMEFVLTGSGDMNEVVNVTEEHKFLFSLESYPGLARDVCVKLEIARKRRDGIYYASEADRERQATWIAELCVRFLQNNRGLTLPRKWESCRARLEEVAASGGDPLSLAAYVYAGIGGPLTLQGKIDSDVASPAQK